MAAPVVPASGVQTITPPKGQVGIARGPQSTVFTMGATTVTLNGATPVTVADTAITATSAVLFTLATVGGTVGAYPAVKTITPGTGFTVAGTAADTSTYNVTRIG